MGPLKLLSGIIIIIVLSIGSYSFFTVDETESAVLFRLGEVVRSDFKPGFYWKIPFVNNVKKFDQRIQTLDAEPELYLTREKKNVIVDSFVKWKINDVRNYYTATGGDARRANTRLSQFIKDGLRSEFGKRTIQEVISGERAEIMDIMTIEANKTAVAFGINIVDVRVKRIDLDKEISVSVYRRMEAERRRVANDYRARGEEEAEKLRADADRKKTIILAEAYRDSEIFRGEGDGLAANIYAKAYSKDAKFYSLYRSLAAYKSTFANKGDMLVIEPNSEFFKYFK
jgi:membrane protease subunit HflC